MAPPAADQPSRLSDGRIEEELRGLPNWRREGSAIAREFHFADAAEAARFLSRVDDIARRLQHDPEVEHHDEVVRLALTTHDVGGISARDIQLAHLVQEMPEGRGGQGGHTQN